MKSEKIKHLPTCKNNNYCQPIFTPLRLCWVIGNPRGRIIIFSHAFYDTILLKKKNFQPKFSLSIQFPFPHAFSTSPNTPLVTPKKTKEKNHEIFLQNQSKEQSTLNVIHTTMRCLEMYMNSSTHKYEEQSVNYQKLKYPNNRRPEAPRNAPTMARWQYIYEIQYNYSSGCSFHVNCDKQVAKKQLGHCVKPHYYQTTNLKSMRNFTTNVRAI